MANHVFLSYAREDIEIAQRIYIDLISIGVEVWFDKKNLRPGEKWKTAISKAIKECKYFLAIISKTSVDKKGFVQKELHQALEVLEEVPEHHIFVIPVRTENCMPSNSKLLDLNFVDLFPSYSDGIKKLKTLFYPEAKIDENQKKPDKNRRLVSIYCRRFGDEERQLAYGLDVDGQGNIVITGSFWGSVDFGGGVLRASGDRNIFLAKFNSECRHLWSRSYGNSGEQVGVAAHTDSKGSIILTSAFTGQLDFGGKPLISRGRYNVALTKLDFKGEHLWSKCFGDDRYHVPECHTVAKNGNIIITGRFQGSINFGGATIESQSAQTDIFVVSFSQDGEHLWSKRFGGPYEQQTRDISVNLNGEIALTGIFKGVIDFDAFRLSAGTNEEYMGYILKLDALGNVLWAKTFGEPSVQQGSAITFDKEGYIYASGIIRGVQRHLKSVTKIEGDAVTLLAQYTPSGILCWSRTFGDSVFSSNLALNSKGDILLTGYFGGSADFGDKVLVSAGGFDIFVLQVTGDGTICLAEQYGDERQQFLVKGAFLPTDQIVLTGSFHGTIDFGAETLIASGYDGSGESTEDIFLTILKSA